VHMEVIHSIASDHLPIVAELRWRRRFRFIFDCTMHWPEPFRLAPDPDAAAGGRGPTTSVTSPYSDSVRVDQGTDRRNRGMYPMFYDRFPTTKPAQPEP
jgi:hypothetical protein